jgi:uncharacterized membrane protein YgcG
MWRLGLRVRAAVPGRVVVVIQATAAAAAGVVALGSVVVVSPAGMAAFPFHELFSARNHVQAAEAPVVPGTPATPDRLEPHSTPTSIAPTPGTEVVVSTEPTTEDARSKDQETRVPNRATPAQPNGTQRATPASPAHVPSPKPSTPPTTPPSTGGNGGSTGGNGGSTGGNGGSSGGHGGPGSGSGGDKPSTGGGGAGGSTTPPPDTTPGTCDPSNPGKGRTSTVPGHGSATGRPGYTGTGGVGVNCNGVGPKK